MVLLTLRPILPVGLIVVYVICALAYGFVSGMVGGGSRNLAMLPGKGPTTSKLNRA